MSRIGVCTRVNDPLRTSTTEFKKGTGVSLLQIYQRCREEGQLKERKICAGLKGDGVDVTTKRKRNWET